MLSGKNLTREQRAVCPGHFGSFRAQEGEGGAGWLKGKEFTALVETGKLSYKHMLPLPSKAGLPALLQGSCFPFLSHLACFDLDE